MYRERLKAGWETFLETLRRPLDMSGLENAADQDEQDELELSSITHISVYKPDPPKK